MQLGFVSDERSVKILFLRGGNGVSVVCRLEYSGVRSRDRQLGFVTTVSPNCLVSNHWVFWVVYQRVAVLVMIFRL